MLTVQLCPLCHTSYDDVAFRFCPVDATPLVDASPRRALGRAPEAAAAPPPPPDDAVPSARPAPVATRKVTSGRASPPSPTAAHPEVPAPASPSAATETPTRIEKVVTAPGSRPVPAATPAFSETEWFRRPIPADAIDPETGKVLVPEEAYVADRARTAAERRGYSLEVPPDEPGEA